jgi:hypothetical protein
VASFTVAGALWNGIRAAQPAFPDRMAFQVSRQTAVRALGGALFGSAAFAAGWNAASTVGGFPYAWIATPENLLWVTLSFSPLVLAAVAIGSAVAMNPDERDAPGRAVPLLCAALAILVSPASLAFVGLRLPIWVPLLGVALWLVTRPSSRTSSLVVDPAKALDLVRIRASLERRDRTARAQLQSGELTPGEHKTQQASVARLAAELPPDVDPVITDALLGDGPHHQWLANAKEAVRLGSWLAIIPLVYVAWITISDLEGETGHAQVTFFLVFSLTAEALRWLGASFVFGALYSRLPGRAGPVRALTLGAVVASVVLLSCLLDARGPFANSTALLFGLFQLVVFLQVLAVLFDRETLRHAGGSWSDIQDIYGINRFQSVATYTAPLLISLLALGQQILAGNGGEFVGTVLEAVGSLPPTP